MPNLETAACADLLKLTGYGKEPSIKYVCNWGRARGGGGGGSSKMRAAAYREGLSHHVYVRTYNISFDIFVSMIVLWCLIKI